MNDKFHPFKKVKKLKKVAYTFVDTWEKYGHPESEIMDSTAYRDPTS